MEGSFKDLELNNNWKSVPPCPIKWQTLKFFAELYKSHLYPKKLFNVVKGAVSDLRQFLVIQSLEKS